MPESYASEAVLTSDAVPSSSRLGETALADLDPELAQAIADESSRQADTIEMIASENYASRQVMEALGSPLTNKYAEGYPGRRWYRGCEKVDAVEQIAIERAKMLFGAEHANVQPHSGSQANAAAYLALAEVGDTILAMSLAHGGHLTHGKDINFSGKTYRFVHYGTDRETGRIDYDRIAVMAEAERPRIVLAGASAYSRIIDFARLREIADSVGASLVVDMAHIAGLVAGGEHPSPVPYADVVTGTTHKTLRGPRGGLILCRKRLAKRIDRAVFPGIQGGPLMHVIAAKAVAFGEAMRPEFARYQHQVVVNAQALAKALCDQGFCLVSGGTDNHMMLVDLTDARITGSDAAIALERVGIACNKNVIPFDQQPPLVTSGIRLGTPAATTRGMGVDEMRIIAQWIGYVLRNPDDEALIEETRAQTLALCTRFPVPA